MNINQFGLYQSLVNYGIQPEFLKLLPFQPVEIIPYNRHGYLLRTETMTYALWIYHGPEPGLIRQNTIFSIYRKYYKDSFLYPLCLNNGFSYGEMDERTWFYITEWPELYPVSYRNQDQLTRMIKMIVQFRRVSVNNQRQLLIQEPGDRHLLARMNEYIENLNSFKMLAEHRLRPTQYDRLFLKEYPQIFADAILGYELLQQSEYLSMLNTASERSLIINDFSRNNIRVDSTGHIYCLNLKHCRPDLGIIDLVELLLKSGRSNRWSEEWYRGMLQTYRQFFEISSDEIEIIKALLRFPWSIYRLSERYYFNRVDWSVFKFLGKLERRLWDRKIWLELGMRLV